MARRKLQGLTLFDYSDRELLHIVDEEAAAEGDYAGWSESDAIAERLGIDTDYPATNVGMRLGWLRRYGAVEKHAERGKHWRVTPIGRALMDGQLAAEELATLNEMDPAKMLMLTRYLTGKYRRSGVTAAHLIRREWTRGTRPPE